MKRFLLLAFSFLLLFSCGKSGRGTQGYDKDLTVFGFGENQSVAELYAKLSYQAVRNGIEFQIAGEDISLSINPVTESTAMDMAAILSMTYHRLSDDNYVVEYDATTRVRPGYDKKFDYTWSGEIGDFLLPAVTEALLSEYGSSASVSGTVYITDMEYSESYGELEINMEMRIHE